MDAARKAGAAATLLAGLAHARLAPGHFEEWWGYGVGFVLAAFLQVVLALALLADAFRGPGARPGDAWIDTLAARGAVALNAALLAAYAVSRVWGVPWLGPEAWEPEPVAAFDVATKALEAVGAAALGAWLWRRRLPARVPAAAA